MRRISILTIAALSMMGFVQAQNNVLNMQLSDITVKKGGQDAAGLSQTVPLVLNKTTSRVSLFDDGATRVQASYKLVSYNSRRSENKNSGIKVKIEYTCTHNGRTITNNKEKMFFLNDNRSFEEKEKLVFTSKVKSEVVELRYNGQMEE